MSGREVDREKSMASATMAHLVLSITELHMVIRTQNRAIEALLAGDPGRGKEYVDAADAMLSDFKREADDWVYMPEGKSVP